MGDEWRRSFAGHGHVMAKAGAAPGNQGLSNPLYEATSGQQDEAGKQYQDNQLYETPDMVQNLGD